VPLGGHDALDHRSGEPVVDRVDQLVGAAGIAEVGFEVEVDLEGLGPHLLLGADADDPEGAQPADLDQVWRVAHGGAP
jgi:hypothetical protein